MPPAPDMTDHMPIPTVGVFPARKVELPERPGSLRVGGRQVANKCYVNIVGRCGACGVYDGQRRV
ncbi:MAG: hypothetical protein R2788_20640 [Saprospiraceae bacterium]